MGNSCNSCAASLEINVKVNHGTEKKCETVIRLVWYLVTDIDIWSVIADDREGTGKGNGKIQ